MGDFKGAIEDYNQAIAIDSNYAKAYYNRGVVNLKTSDLMNALNDFKKAIALQADYPEAVINRDIVLERIKN